MTKPVIVADIALRKLVRAARWYDRERRGLGDELVENVEDVFAALGASEVHELTVPGIPKEVGLRRVLVARFSVRSDLCRDGLGEPCRRGRASAQAPALLARSAAPPARPPPKKA